ncbi:MAG: hypothetical protein J3R72DRAFT_464499 [Linnemannia gamsii]|nr:MAG: hypothetical protein J3R72DRAFT_464499 [Linnemannia gamsii]
MLSCGRFKEGQPGPDGIYRINLSSDMFEPKIMDTLLDYVYTREPIHDDDTTGNDSVGIGNTTEEYCHHDSNRNVYADNYKSISDPPVMDRHHHASANVALNLQTAISEPSPLRSHHPQSYSYCQSNTYKGSNSLWSFTPAPGTTPSTTIQQQPPPPTPPHIIPYASRHTRSIRTRLKPEDWFLLYRAAIHMEDPTLQAQALDKIQAQLNVQSALERALTWGPGYPEIKRVVLKYVFDERRAIFGDEEQNQLRPYLWPEIEDQVDVLVEITSKIARQ